MIKVQSLIITMLLSGKMNMKKILLIKNISEQIWKKMAFLKNLLNGFGCFLAFKVQLASRLLILVYRDLGSKINQVGLQTLMIPKTISKLLRILKILKFNKMNYLIQQVNSSPQLAFCMNTVMNARQKE